MMTLNQPVTSSDNNQSLKYSKIADKAFSCVNEHLTILISQMLNSADKKLYDLSEQATSDEELMKYLDCTRIFCTEKNDISHHFFMNLNNSLSTSKAHSTSSDDAEPRLIDQDELEEMVAITTMHAKAMNLFGEEVSDLEARLEYIELMCEKSIDKESLDPKHICQVFQKTIENVEIAIEVKLVFYKLFDEEVCSKLGIMYKTINQIFIENGVLPDVLLKTTKQEEIEEDDDEVSAQVASYYDPAKNAATDFIPRSKKDFSHIANEFMSGEMTITGEELQLPESFSRTPTQQNLNGKNCYERKEVLKALSALQRKITSSQKDTASLTTEQIKQELIADISKKHGGTIDKQVNLLDERSMDFVGMMFGAIVDDDRVSEIMTNLIYQLQIPVMKVAMVDRSVFESETHPARATVDLLTTAGMGINLKEDRIYSDLEEIVDSILEKFDIDIIAFEKAVDDLEDIIKKEEQLTTETERQQQKQILQEHARKIVINQLKMVSCEKQIPDNIRPLVLKHWSTLMLNRYIHHGRNSEQWVQSVLLLKLLLKCIQPITYASQYKLLKNNHESLLQAVNDELYDTQQDQNDIAKQMAELKSYILQMIDDYGNKVVDGNDKEMSEQVLNEASTGTTEVELEHAQQQQTKMARQKLAKLTSSVKPGVWYEIYNGKNKAVRRLKLSVILAETAQLIFVDRKGLKVIEKDAEEFANELEENRSRLLADHSTFAHALGNVISALAA